MNRKKYNEIKRATAKILKEFGIISSDDLYSKGNTICVLYENLKAGILEEFDIDKSEIEKILDDILS